MSLGTGVTRAIMKRQAISKIEAIGSGGHLDDEAGVEASE